jgi:hypothetical protein
MEVNFNNEVVESNERASSTDVNVANHMKNSLEDAFFDAKKTDRFCSLKDDEPDI